MWSSPSTSTSASRGRCRGSADRRRLRSSRPSSDPDRGFDAVVIGEPARAFYGNQFGLTFPVFVHYGVELWVPEVGGKVDPGSRRPRPRHGALRRHVQGRAQPDQDPRPLGHGGAGAARGSVPRWPAALRLPAGRRRRRTRTPARPPIGQRLHRLEPDPIAAPIVRAHLRRVRRRARALRHRRGAHPRRHPLPQRARPGPQPPPATARAWCEVRGPGHPANPRYTGRQVWNRQRRDEVLLDVEDVARATRRSMRWNDEPTGSGRPSRRTSRSSAPRTSPRCRRRWPLGAHRPTTAQGARRRPRVATSSAGLVLCGALRSADAGQPRTTTTPTTAAASPPSTPLANEVDHPKTVYVREDAIVPAARRVARRAVRPGEPRRHRAKLWPRPATPTTRPRPGPRRPAGSSPTATPGWPSTGPRSTPAPTPRSSPDGWPRSRASASGRARPTSAAAARASR